MPAPRFTQDTLNEILDILHEDLAIDPDDDLQPLITLLVSLWNLLNDQLLRHAIMSVMGQFGVNQVVVADDQAITNVLAEAADHEIDADQLKEAMGLATEKLIQMDPRFGFQHIGGYGEPALCGFSYNVSAPDDAPWCETCNAPVMDKEPAIIKAVPRQDLPEENDKAYVPGECRFLFPHQVLQAA